MKRTILFMTVIALVLGLSNIVFASNYSEFMESAQNALKVGNSKTALEDASSALKLKKNADAKAYALIGDIRFGNKDYELAMKNWYNAIQFKIKEPAEFKAKRAKQMFALGCSQLANLRAAIQFFSYAQRLGYPLSDIKKAKVNYGESILQSASNRKEALPAVPYIGQVKVDEVFPKIILQTVLTKTIPGVGLEDGDEIKALARDQKFDGVLELQTGDKVVITGDVFWHETSEGWEEFKGGITLNVVNAIHVYVAAEDGQNIKVEVMRKIISTNLVYNN